MIMLMMITHTTILLIQFGNAPLRLAYLFHRRDVMEYLRENLKYHKYF